MIVTTSNVLVNAPSVTSGSSSDLPANIIDQDFSLNYTASSTSLTMNFGSVGTIEYVAIAGISIGSSGTVTLKNGTTTISTVSLVRNNVVVFRFEAQSFSSLIVTISASSTPTVTYVAAGATLTIPNSGAVAGHRRSWLERSYKARTTVNASSAPVAVLIKPIAKKGTLKMPNIDYLWSHNEWQTFLDFAIDGLFFINENSMIPESSYCCFEFTQADVKAHGSTRKLNNLSSSFRVFSGV